MHTKTLILVYGFAASGKTSTGIEIAKRLKLPLLTKDSIQELIYDGLGTGDADYQKAAAKTSYRLADYFLRQLMLTGSSVVFEGNLSCQYDTPRFLKLQEDFGYAVVQVRCGADAEVLEARLIERAQSADRHAGHNDLEKLPQLREQFAKRVPENLNESWVLIEHDTTDFSKVDFEMLAQKVQEAGA
ncbi:hypothetical protein BH11PAT4_BH11PAT4_8090 [soil metagenome]